MKNYGHLSEKQDFGRLSHYLKLQQQREWIITKGIGKTAHEPKPTI
jgi:hypothetical protein